MSPSKRLAWPALSSRATLARLVRLPPKVAATSSLRWILRPSTPSPMYSRREYPTLPILGEESGHQIDLGQGWVWIVDPIDGTRNFASSVPHFSTVIALAHDGDVRVGVTHDPVRAETFYAMRGEGAFLNGRRIHVVPDDHLADGILGLDLSYCDSGAADQLRVVLDLWPGMQTVRILGSAALGLAYVAAGRFHVFFPSQARGLGSGRGPSPRSRGGGPGLRSLRPTRIPSQRWHNRRQSLPPRRVHPPRRQLSMDHSSIRLTTSLDVTAAVLSTIRNHPHDFDVDLCASMFTTHLASILQADPPHTCTVSNHFATANPGIPSSTDRTNPAYSADVHMIHSIYYCHSESSFSSLLHANR